MFVVTLTGNTSGINQFIQDSVLRVAQSAALYWERYLDLGGRSIEIEIDIASLGSGVLAEAGPGNFVSLGPQSGFNDVLQAGTISEILTGVDPNGSVADIFVTISRETLLGTSGQFFLGDFANNNIPFNQFDLFSTLVHEYGHGLGLFSFQTPNVPSDRVVATIDLLVERVGNFGFNFVGANAQAVFGGPVPFDGGDPSHVSQGLNELLSPAVSSGERLPITPLDVAIFQDLDIPIFMATEGNNDLFGFEVADTANLLAGDDSYTGLGGNDTVNGGVGRDTIDGGDGNDNLMGGGGFDSLFGGNGSDTLDGGAGADFLNGGNDADFLNGATNNDTIDGGAGNDTILGESGFDSVFGGDGDDTIEVAGGFDTVFGGGGNDTIRGLSGRDSLEGGDGNDLIDGGSNVDTIRGGAGDDTLFATSGFDLIDGGTGNDLIDGGPGPDTLLGGAGNDTVLGGVGPDSIEGGEGNDRLDGATNNDTVFGGAGDDTLLGESGFDFLSGDAGDDVINTSGGNDTANGGAGNDVIDTGNGADVIDGGAGNDLINAGTNSDVITGGSGNDTITASSGGDTFIFANGFGNDVLTDFRPNNALPERIDLSAVSQITSFQDLANNHLSANGNGDAVITDGANSITLLGVSVASLTSDDFIF